MVDKKHEELCNCPFCRNERRKLELAKQNKAEAKRKARVVAKAKTGAKGKDVELEMEQEDVELEMEQEEDAPPHHFHTEYVIELGPGDEGFEPDPSENSLDPDYNYRLFDRQLKLQMKSQRKMIEGRKGKPPTSPTEVYERMVRKS
jgi:hypothetical protein